MPGAAVAGEQRVGRFRPSASSLVALRPALAAAPESDSETVALPETGETSTEFAPFDELMRRFLTENKLPGAAIAVAKRGESGYSS